MLWTMTKIIRDLSSDWGVIIKQGNKIKSSNIRVYGGFRS